MIVQPPASAEDKTNLTDGASSIPREGRILAIDPGEKRIGIALSDPTQTIAQPLCTLTKRAGQRFPFRKVFELIEKHSPVGIVLGLPIAMNGSEDDRALAVRELGIKMNELIQLPVAYCDERFSTARALSAVRDLGGRTRGQKAKVDSLAATVFLQAFLDTRLS